MDALLLKDTSNIYPRELPEMKRIIRNVTNRNSKKAINLELDEMIEIITDMRKSLE